MSKTNYYPTVWQSVPFSFELYNWDTHGRCIKDLVLKNEVATARRVSKMQLNISRFSAFDRAGKEHFIADFPGQDSLSIKGIHAGDFLRSKGVLLLAPGFYTVLRFYLSRAGNTFTYSDRVEEPADGFEYLDFEIENGLAIEGDASPEAILRFDFVPFTASKFNSAIKNLFKIPHVLAGKLVGSMGD